MTRQRTLIPEARRNQYQVNPTLKSAVVQASMHAHTQLCKAFTITEAELFNISLTTQVTSVLCTIHHILRQSSNPNAVGKLAEKVGEHYTIHRGLNQIQLPRVLAHEQVS